MPTTDLSLFGGLIFGLLSTLHCAAMCGGACGRMLLLTEPKSGRAQLASLGLLQVGRIIVYAGLGGLTGAFGAWFAPGSESMAFNVLHWLVAISLIWIGLVTAGMLPRLAVMDQAFTRTGSLVGTALRPLTTRPVAGPVSLGMVWGFSACPMVYGAAFAASLTGTALHGAAFMTAFGLGTIPGVLSGGAVVHWLSQVGRSRSTQVMAGIALVTFGFATIYMPLPELLAMCVSG